MRIALLWTIAIVIVSFLPGEAKEVIGTETRSPIPAVQHRAAVRHTTGHLMAFGIAALLFTIASAKKSHRLYYLFMIAVLGLIIEYFEHAIYGSTFEWWDVRDDSLAATVGYLFGLLLAIWLRAADHSTNTINA
jgi:hypothetical protein